MNPREETPAQALLVLRLAAPLMSFGAAAVDQERPTGEFPGRALLAGLLANALGHDHADAARTAALQARLRHAARADRPGRRLVDFQTVDLGQAHLREAGWTTRGAPEGRGGGDAATATHIRRCHYVADGVYTVVAALAPDGDDPDLAALAAALRAPARPLFLGRKCCLPARPLLLGVLAPGRDAAWAPDLREALARLPRDARAAAAGPLRAWWPADGDDAAPRADAWLGYAADERDWRAGLIGGRRPYHAGTVDPPPAAAPAPQELAAP